MWYFTSPQIVFGEESLAALEDLRGRRALIVSDKTIVALGLLDRVTTRLSKSGISYEVFDEVEPDPSLQTVRAGARMALDVKPDWVIGLGGGSPMDAAKAIWVVYERPDLDPAEINPIVDLGLRRKARLITIPTTSGTGAEVTWAIVLTDTEAGRKLGLGNRENTADLAIVDPAMAAGMPRQLTIDTGLDALTHAVEGFTCTWHTDMTDGICLQAARLVLDNLPRAAADGGDLAARERMHNAATLAGLGFGNAMASMAHACGHALGACFHVPHGRAVGLMLPYTIQFMAAEAPERFADLSVALGWAQGDAKTSARNLAAKLLAFRSSLGQPAAIKDLNIPRVDYEASLDHLVDSAFNDTCLMTAARAPSYEELQAFFESAYEGSAIDY